MTVYVVLAHGFEEIEAVSIIDMLRRGRVAVKTAGIGGYSIKGAHGIVIGADVLIDAVEPCIGDYIIIPGGMGGVEECERSEELTQVLRKAAAAGVKFGAICAGPRVLCRLGLLDGYNITCYPGLEEQMTGAKADSSEAVVKDKNRTTGRAPGSSLHFAYELLCQIKGERTADKIKRDMVCAF